MARRGPSLTALLGLLAVAGFQNRDKLSDLARKIQAPNAQPQIASGFGDQIKDVLSGSPVGEVLTSAVAELMDMFKGTAQEEPAKSWVASGQNAHVAPDDLANVLGEETLLDLSEKTGMSQVDLLAALSQKLPVAIDAMTPHGRLPSIDEAGDYV